MKLLNKIQTQFYNSSAFKGLLNDYSKQAGVKIAPEASIKEIVSKEVKEELYKNDLLAKKEKGAYRMRNVATINSQVNPDRKFASDIPFSMMRRMATIYPIARACINRRIRQITQLDWDVTTIDELDEEKGFEAQIKYVKDYFKKPMGHKTRLRELLTMMVDDILTVDATTFEITRLRNKTFDTERGLIPVDPTTIALRLTETGGTPMPPEPAYTQIIEGHVVGQFTTDEMIYESMMSRSYNPYGLAPLESLILQTESAVRGALYNLAYFKESNVPEGFITLPEEVVANKDQVEDWQFWFDSMVAGDPRFMRRLKILPGGSEYTPAKKPEDMAFERFELWLLQQTCAVFDVPPQDIGITYQINKATSETQANLSVERGLLPLGNLIKEIFDYLIQDVMGFEQLQWVWQNINPVDRKEEVELAEKEIKMGALSVDEYRMEHGREPLGLEHFIIGGQPFMVKDVISGKAMTYNQTQPEETPTDNTEKPKDSEPELDEEDKKEKAQIQELVKWRKCIYRDLELARPLRTKFPSLHISDDVKKSIQFGLDGVKNRQQAKMLFDEFLDPEIKASIKLLKVARQMRGIENATLTEDDQ
jgi:hypothetical protein